MILAKIRKYLCSYPIAVIIIFGILMRFLVFCLYHNITLYPDSRDYIYLAERLLSFDLSGYEGQRPPGYPLLLSLAGLSNGVVVLLQFAMGVLSLIYVYKILLLTVVRKGLSLIITLAISCYLPIVFFEYAILTESLTLFIITLIFYQFFKLITNKDVKQNKAILKLTLLCSFLVLIKMFYVFLPVLLFAFILLHQQSLRIVFSKYIFITVVPVFVFLGWSYVNKVNTGYFVSSTFYGFNIAQNCVWFADKTTPEYEMIGEVYSKYRLADVGRDREVAMIIWKAYPELEVRTGLSFPDLSKLLYDYSLATIKKNPIEYLAQVVVSARDFWKTSLYWEPENFVVMEALDTIYFVCYTERIALQLIKAMFLLLIPFNVIMAIRKRKVSPQFAISTVVFVTCVLQAFATYGTNSRFSFPFETLMVVSVVLNMIQYKQYRIKQKTVV